MNYFDLSRKIYMCKCCKNLFTQKQSFSSYCPVCQDARKRFVNVFAKGQGGF